MTTLTERGSSFDFIGSGLWPKTTVIFDTLVALRAETICSMKLFPLIGSSAFGLPMRRDSPADKTMAAIMALESTRQLHPETDLPRSEEHTSELQSQSNLVCRLLLEK